MRNEQQANQDLHDFIQLCRQGVGSSFEFAKQFAAQADRIIEMHGYDYKHLREYAETRTGVLPAQYDFWYQQGQYETYEEFVAAHREKRTKQPKKKTNLVVLRDQLRESRELAAQLMDENAKLREALAEYASKFADMQGQISELRSA